jgi:hypothetical protein
MTGRQIALRVWWAAGGWVAGTAHVQRWNSGSWQYVNRSRSSAAGEA